MVGTGQYTLRGLFLAITAVSVYLALAVGLLRFGNYVVTVVERDYWQDKIGEGEYPPGKYPASLFTANEIAELRAKSAQAKDGDASD